MNVKKSALITGHAAAVSLLLVTLPAAAPAVAADDRQAYNQRRAEQFATLFTQLDRDRDRVVTRLEARGHLNFEPHFGDMDIDRNDAVTAEELARFVERETNVRIERTAPPAGAAVPQR